MEFCPFHKKDCEENEMITIVELKKGKIKQIKVCQKCISNYLEISNKFFPSEVPENVEDFLKLLLDNKEAIESCPSCLELNVEEDKLTCEQKIKILENKMAAAVKIEDYETAAMIKKQIDKLRI